MKTKATVLKKAANAIIYTIMPFLFLQGQNVGIGTATPDASALLDLHSENSGLLIPRMSQQQKTGIPDPATGLLVFVNDDSSFYYNQGSNWKRIPAEGDNWQTIGNNNATNKFIGTLDTSALRLRTNNKEHMVLLANGRIGINTATPSTVLHIVDDGSYYSDITLEYNAGKDPLPEIAFRKSGGTFAQKLAPD